MRSISATTVLMAVLSAQNVLCADIVLYPLRTTPLNHPASFVPNQCTWLPSHLVTLSGTGVPSFADPAAGGSVAPGHQTPSPWMAAADLESRSGLHVQELPAGPESDTLALMGFLGMGAFSVLRSARQWHFGHLPDWCHHAGPVQIGHAAVFDSAGPSVEVAVWSNLVNSTWIRKDSQCGRLWDLPSRRESRHLPFLSAPRGPPSPAR